MPEAQGLGRRLGVRIEPALDGWQQRQFQRHVALVQFTHDEVQVTAAGAPGLGEKSRAIHQPAALLIDARHTLGLGLQGKTLAHARPQAAATVLRG
ncbi:hypothetical protein [Pseudomonas sp. St386]|uniref:hypothetical protein n=1 Tax=Pseudomonas sp. St386 TaxID=2678256 RepID=UPI001BB414C8|nr:hypothetical protein [Pseudomonas sp. St386]